MCCCVILEDQVLIYGCYRDRAATITDQTLTSCLSQSTVDILTKKNCQCPNIKATLKNFQFSLIMAAPLDKGGSVLPEGRLHFP